MPFAKIIEEENPEYVKLLERLRSEWQSPRPDAASPVIIATTESHLRRHTAYPTRLYVIWDAWGSLSQRERSEIIMDAYEATHRREDLLHVTVAMGLTREEAERIKLRYAIEEAAA